MKQLQISAVLTPACQRLVANQLVPPDEPCSLLAVAASRSVLPHPLKCAAFDRSEQVYTNWLIAQLDSSPWPGEILCRDPQRTEPEDLQGSHDLSPILQRWFNQNIHVFRIARPGVEG